MKSMCYMTFTPKIVGQKLISRNFIMLVVIAICAHYFANFFCKTKATTTLTVWKFHDFPAILILREIKSRESRSAKIAISNIFEAVNISIDLCNFWQLKISQTQNSKPLKPEKWHFSNFFSHKIWEVEKFWNFHTVCTLWSWNSRPRNFLALSMQKCECLWISAAITPRTEVSTVFILLSINLITPA